jgi:hypothetical protein
MPGGLMQLVSQGQQNIVLNGNPTKSFFKSTFAQYTNFSLQKFRVDFEGAKTLRLTEESTFTFKIPRYADLLMDCYLSIAMPNIWSPIMPPQEANGDEWSPYEFKWIENLGAKMISKISIICGNYTLQEYSGDYLLASVQRDFNNTKKALFNEMIGQTNEVTDPANSGSRINSYPNAYYTNNVVGAEPSIRGRILYIPLNNWFGLRSQMAFPLTSLQYNELQIVITIRPINQLFQIRDVFDYINNFPYIAPNFNQWYMQFYRFLQPPPDVVLGIDSYSDLRTLWNTDIHLNCTYCFLSNDEERVFALNEQKYLIRQIHEQKFPNVTGPNKIQLDSISMVTSWLFYFQRSDVNLRNEWSNYSNWPYNYMPLDIIQAPTDGTYVVYRTDLCGNIIPVSIGPGVNPDSKLTGLLITQPYSPENDKNILLTLGILLDGSYRENLQPVGVYNYIEKYTRTSGNAPQGLYCYNFCLNTALMNGFPDLQPSGAINMSIFSKIELEFTTILPPLDPLAQSLVICDPETGVPIGVNKPTWRIYDYNFDLTLFEERLNIVYFVGGNVGMMYAT